MRWDEMREKERRRSLGFINIWNRWPHTRSYSAVIKLNPRAELDGQYTQTQKAPPELSSSHPLLLGKGPTTGLRPAGQSSTLTRDDLTNTNLRFVMEIKFLRSGK